MRKRFESRGVVFVGLTPDSARSLELIQDFLNEYGIDWQNGYGAYESLRGFEAYNMPAVWVIGKDGRVVWNYDSETGLEAGIEKALGGRSEE